MNVLHQFGANYQCLQSVWMRSIIHRSIKPILPTQLDILADVLKCCKKHWAERVLSEILIKTDNILGDYNIIS